MEGARKTMLVMLPRVPDLHDSRDLPVSEMAEPTGIVDQTAMEKPMVDDEAPCGRHLTFSVPADAQTDTSKVRAAQANAFACFWRWCQMNRVGLGRRTRTLFSETRKLWLVEMRQKSAGSAAVQRPRRSGGVARC